MSHHLYCWNAPWCIQYLVMCLPLPAYLIQRWPRFYGSQSEWSHLLWVPSRSPCCPLGLHSISTLSVITLASTPYIWQHVTHPKSYQILHSCQSFLWAPFFPLRHLHHGYQMHRLIRSSQWGGKGILDQLEKWSPVTSDIDGQFCTIKPPRIYNLRLWNCSQRLDIGNLRKQYNLLFTSIFYFFLWVLDIEARPSTGKHMMCARALRA